MPSIINDKNSLETIKAGVLIAAINLGNPVLAQQQKTNELTGISVALAKKLAQALGLKLETCPYPTAGKVVDDCMQGKWDIAFLAVDPKRAELISFTSPYIKIQGTYMVLAASDFYTLEQVDQSHVVINVGKGAAYDLFLSRHLRAATLKRLASSQEAIQVFMENQEGDVVAGVRETLSLAARNNPNFRILDESFTEIKQAVCTPSTNTPLYQIIDEYISQWLITGELEQIIKEEKNPDL